ncbi:MAG: hypothetical protein LBG12_06535, partial [Synergistaceae bacterium]|nr:hypothetical protein [Synergistaceae bacterium]
MTVISLITFISSAMAAAKRVRLKYMLTPVLETVSRVTTEMMMTTTFAFIRTTIFTLDPAAIEPEKPPIIRLQKDKRQNLAISYMSFDFIKNRITYNSIIPKRSAKKAQRKPVHNALSPPITSR